MYPASSKGTAPGTSACPGCEPPPRPPPFPAPRGAPPVDESSAGALPLQDRSRAAHGPDVARIGAPHRRQGLGGAALLRGPAAAVPLEHRAVVSHGPDVVRVQAPDSVVALQAAGRLRCPRGPVPAHDDSVVADGPDAVGRHAPQPVERLRRAACLRAPGRAVPLHEECGARAVGEWHGSWRTGTVAERRVTQRRPVRIPLIRYLTAHSHRASGGTETSSAREVSRCFCQTDLVDTPFWPFRSSCLPHQKRSP